MSFLKAFIIACICCVIIILPGVFLFSDDVAWRNVISLLVIYFLSVIIVWFVLLRRPI